MDFFLEQPIWVGIIGFCLSIGTLYGWVQTGHRGALWSGLGLLVATAIALLISIQVTTTAEKIERMLYEIAELLEANRLEETLQFIHPEAHEIRSRAERELKRYKFSTAKITKLHAIDVDEDYQPPRALVKMNVLAEGAFEGYSGRVPRYVELTLHLHQGRWYIFEYSHQEPMAGFR